ncbi:hypothetical protein Q7P37_007552 [Cladosporium fusiforme]
MSSHSAKRATPSDFEDEASTKKPRIDNVMRATTKKDLLVGIKDPGDFMSKIIARANKAAELSAGSKKRNMESPLESAAPAKKARIDSRPIVKGIKTAESGSSTTSLPKPQGARKVLKPFLKGGNANTAKVSEGTSIDTKSNSPEVVQKPVQKPKQEKAERGINGLMNNSLQCFANSTLQLIDVGLDGVDLDTALGAPNDDHPFEEPEMKPTEKLGPKPRSTKKTISKIRKYKNSILDRITKSRQEGQLKDLSLRKHLRTLLKRMRQHGNNKEKHISGMLFQQILAHGDVEEYPLREQLDGETQEDCHEYFNTVLDGLINDPTASDDVETDVGAALLDSAFSFTTKTVSKCSNSECGHTKGSPMIDRSKTQTVIVPKSKEPVQLRDLLRQATVSELDGQSCELCGKQMQRKSDIEKVGDNFVVYMNRVEYHEIESRKLKTRIELPKNLELCGKDFALSAVVKHSGRSTLAGHYTMFRKRGREYVTKPYPNSLWYHVDDAKVTAVDKEEVLTDGGRAGECVMLLYKAL